MLDTELADLKSVSAPDGEIVFIKRTPSFIQALWFDNGLVS